MKRYSIHSVAELLGISADAIRLYEKEGLVKPLRDEKNGYRYYENEQIHRIMGIHLYRQIDVGLSQIKRMFGIDTFDGLESEFDRLIDSNEARIEQLRRKTDKLRFMKQHIMSVKHGIDRYEIRELPTGYVIHANSTGEIKYSEIKEIFNDPAFPFGNMCYHIKKQGDSFASDSLMLVIREPMIGISPLKDEKKELGRIEGVKSLYTIQSFDEKTAGIEWDFSQIYEYARKHEMECTDEIYAFYVYSLVTGEKIMDYYEIYVPLCDDRKYMEEDCAGDEKAVQQKKMIN